MVMEHTTGPWHRNIGPAKKCCTIFAGKNKHICYLDAQTMSDEEAEANINLIVASPDMLHALRRAALVLAWASEKLGSPAIDDDYKIVSDAIEKATGAKS